MGEGTGAVGLVRASSPLAVKAWVGAAYFAFVTVIVARTHEIEVLTDSARYLGRDGVFDPRQPGILPTALLSTLGEEWALPGQLVVAALAWLFLAWAVHRAVPSRWSAAAALLVLAYSLTTPIISWQWLALSDGLAMSVFVAWIAAVLLLVSANQVVPPWLLSTSVVLVALVRPTLLLIVVPTHLALLWLRRPTGGRRPVALGVLTVSAAWAGWRLWRLNSVDDFRSWYATNNLYGKPGFRSYAGALVEDCEPLVRAMDAWDGIEPVTRVTPTSCPELHAWLLSVRASPGAWIASDPISAAQGFAHALLEQSLPVFTVQTPAIPSSWSSFLLPTDFPVAQFALLCLLIGAVMAVRSGERSGVSRRRLIVALAGAVGTFLYLALSWVSDGIEVARHMMPVTSLAPLMALLLPMLLLSRATPQDVLPPTATMPSGVQHGQGTEPGVSE